MADSEMLYCPKCKKTMRGVNFYQYKDGTKCELCKSCLTMHVDNWDPDTYLWILEKFDVAYNEDFWIEIRNKAYAKDPCKINGTSVVGKYLSKMKLKQYKQWTWDRTEEWKQFRENEAALHGNPNVKSEEQLKEMEEAFHNGEITEAQWLTYKEINKPAETPSLDFIDADGAVTTTGPGQGNNNPYPANDHPFEVIDLPDVGNELTAEDKIYLALKWGRLYKADEWVALEKLYNEFMESFDIQGAARIDTLKMICKTSLKMNTAIDCGDVDTYQKLSRVYDAMMKAAKFTEAQNKADKADFVDSAGQLVAYCEKEGGQIPKLEIKTDHDIVDAVIADLKRYNKSLIYEDKALAQEIEQYLKNKEAAEQMKRDRAEALAQGLEDVELEDEDYVAFKEIIEQDILQDKNLKEEE